EGEQEVLGLDRGAAELSRRGLGVLDRRPRLAGEPFEHQRLLGSTATARSRLACFLWTAWRVTPSASATSAHVQPSRSARSTSASSSWSARRRRAPPAGER